VIGTLLRCKVASRGCFCFGEALANSEVSASLQSSRKHCEALVEVGLQGFKHLSFISLRHSKKLLKLFFF
jgi:hypothetical protein